MGKVLGFVAVALLALCGIWLWMRVRKYTARRRLQDERAVAFVAEAVRAARQSTDTAGTGQSSG